MCFSVASQGRIKSKGSFQSVKLKHYRFCDRNVKVISDWADIAYTAFTVNAVSTKAGTLPLNYNHAVTLNFRYTYWIEPHEKLWF